jgi:hypothetical protein
MHISTKSPQAHVFFEKAMAKMEMLHTADGLENFRNAVQADPHLPWDTSCSPSFRRTRASR